MYIFRYDAIREIKSFIGYAGDKYGFFLDMQATYMAISYILLNKSLARIIIIDFYLSKWLKVIKYLLK